MSAKYFYGYRIVAASSVIQMAHLGCVFTFGVLFPAFESEFGWSRALISGASSLNFFLLGIFGIVIGFATDRYGPRIVLTSCGLLFAIGFLLMYRMTEIWQLYLYYGCIAGIGMAAHDIATLSTVTRWFVRYRGLMSGFVKAGAGIGQVIVPPIAVFLLIAYGWRTSSLVVGTCALFIIVIAAQFMRRDPASLDLRPFGEEMQLNSKESDNENGCSLREAIAKRSFWILSFAKLSDMFCLFTIVIHIVPHGIDQGFSSGTAVAVLSTIGGSSILGRVLLGAVFDRVGPWRSLLICFSLLLSALLLIQLSSQPKWLFLFALIYGIGHGGFFAIAAPSIGHYFGTKSHGLIFGVLIFVGTLGGTAGPLLSGYLFDITGNYDIAFMVLTGFAISGLFLAALLRVVDHCEQPSFSL